MTMHQTLSRPTVLGAFVLATIVVSSVAIGAPAWYGGTVDYIQPYNGGVAVAFVESTLDDCQNDRVWLKDSVLGEKRVDRLYAMALAAQASGRRIEFVIDKAINGMNGECVAMGNSLIRTQ